MSAKTKRALYNFSMYIFQSCLIAKLFFMKLLLISQLKFKGMMLHSKS